MEAKELNYIKLQQVLNEFINDLAAAYKNKLKQTGKSATGNLIRSIAPQSVSFEAGNLSVSLKVADYWIYVEEGRRPGRFAPPEAIKQWIEVKKIMPRPQRGVKISQNQLAFLINRKIKEKGIKPGNQLSKSIDEVYKRFEQRISNAVSQDIELFIDNSNVELL